METYDAKLIADQEQSKMAFVEPSVENIEKQSEEKKKGSSLSASSG